MTPSLEMWPTKAKEASSRHEVRLAPLDTNPVFNIAVEKFNKKNLVKLELSKEIFLSPEYPDFGSKF